MKLCFGSILSGVTAMLDVHSYCLSMGFTFISLLYRAHGCNNLQNCRVYQLLGEAGTYYGVRFGKNPLGDRVSFWSNKRSSVCGQHHESTSLPLLGSFLVYFLMGTGICIYDTSRIQGRSSYSCKAAFLIL